jgi:dienelactone hydrolase
MTRRILRELKARYRLMLIAVNRRFPFIGDSFRLGLEDKKAAVCADMKPSSNALLLAFGGMAGRLGIPPFEFLSMTGDLEVKRLFVRDLRQSWYHRGIPGYGSTLEEVAESLEGLIAEQDVDRLVVTGVSAGGYAALLFGCLLGADSVVALVPQGTIDADTFAKIGDPRQHDRLDQVTAEGALDPKWTDLRTALPRERRADTKYMLFFDQDYQPDRVQAEHLAGLEGVELHPVPGGAHKVASKMRATGELERILRSELAASTPTPREPAAALSS